MPRLPRLLLLLYCLALCFVFASSAPVRAKRQNTSGSGTTSSVIDTPNGPMLQTCTITLTPTTNGNGAPAFQEVKSCNMKPVTPNGASSATLPPTAGSSTSSAQSVNSTPLTPPTTTTHTLVPPTPPTPVVTASSSVSSSTPSPGTINGASSASPPSASNGSTSPNASSIPFAAPGVVSPTNSSITGSRTSTSASSTSAASAAEADQASQSATQNFKIPGKSLSVLPIGLGVFAGILVIALIVVGLVTYERTKYRKAFRQQRLAETGPNMGQV